MRSFPIATYSQNGKPARWRVLSAPVDGVSESDLIDLILVNAESESGLAITYLTAWTLVQVERDPDFQELLQGFDIVYADGIGVVLALWLTTFRRIRKVTANDFFFELCVQAARRNLSVAFVGTQEGITDEVARIAREQIPGLEIKLTAKGYLTPPEESSVLQHLEREKPHIVLLGRGQPLQEEWVQQCRSLLPTTVFFCVGGLFDYVSGRVRHTPRWIRRCGFEWLHRLTFNFQTYWRIYVFGLPILFGYIARHNIRRLFPGFGLFRSDSCSDEGRARS